MRTFLALLFLATVAAGAQPKQKLLTRTPQQDLELRHWIEGIMQEAQDATAEAEAAEREAKESRAQAAIVKGNLSLAIDRVVSLEHQIAELGKDRDRERTAKEAALAQVEAEKKKTAEEKKGRLAAEAHVSKIKTWLSVALGALLIALVNYLPFGLFPMPMSLYLRAGASVAAAAAAWAIVARFV